MTVTSTSKALVTGGAGFIGSHLVERLVRDGRQVTVVDNLTSGRLSNLNEVRDVIRFVEGDVQNYALIRELSEDVDTVVHLAALGSVPRSVAHPLPTHESNSTGTVTALTAARDAGVSRFVFASSSSVYGDEPNLPKIESRIGNPLSPYAVSKRTGEQYCEVFNRLYEIETVSLRFYNVFGPRQRADHAYAAVIPLFLDAALDERPLQILGDGEQSRDFTFVLDNVEGIVAAVDADANAVAGKVFNLACEARTTLNELIGLLGSVLDRPLSTVHLPPRDGDIRHSLASTDALRTATSFSPKYSLAEGLEATAEWFVDGCP